MADNIITCAFVNLKPGTTKSTSSVYTAVALHALGRRVCLVDADRAASVQRWADLADAAGQRFPFDVVGFHRRSIARDLPQFLSRYDVDAVVIDTPQMEDHADVTRGAMAVTDTWIVPVAPAGIELDRTALVAQHMDQVSAITPHAAKRLALLTRTNRRKPSKTEGTPDYDTRAALPRYGLEVFPDQVPLNDQLYRQCYGALPDATGTPYEALAEWLIEQAGGSVRHLRAVGH